MPSKSEQTKLAQDFHQLHIKGSPVILFNVWDAGSARVVANSGAKAIATGSWSVAAAHGYADGQVLSLDLAIENLARITAAVKLPVTIDLEAGYGDAPDVVAASVARAIAAGAIGFNIEDQLMGRSGLYSIADQSQRIAAARTSADAAAIPAFINARTDIFLKAPADKHDDAMVDEALQRAQAYAKAGASGFFVPGLADEKLMAKLCKACSLPVNIIVMPSSPTVKRMAELGVARISHGPGPYRQMMRMLEETAQAIYAA
jgi:2-methylisocitrate lyase-like PEP mutase family enzyme